MTGGAKPHLQLLSHPRHLIRGLSSVHDARQDERKLDDDGGEEEWNVDLSKRFLHRASL